MDYLGGSNLLLVLSREPFPAISQKERNDERSARKIILLELDLPLLALMMVEGAMNQTM